MVIRRAIINEEEEMSVQESLKATLRINSRRMYETSAMALILGEDAIQNTEAVLGITHQGWERRPKCFCMMRHVGIKQIDGETIFWEKKGQIKKEQC